METTDRKEGDHDLSRALSEDKVYAEWLDLGLEKFMLYEEYLLRRSYIVAVGPCELKRPPSQKMEEDYGNKTTD